MTFRAIVPLLCGALLLLVGVTSVRASEFAGRVSFAQSKESSGATRIPLKCSYNSTKKMCGGWCPSPKKCYLISDFPRKCGCK